MSELIGPKQAKALAVNASRLSNEKESRVRLAILLLTLILCTVTALSGSAFRYSQTPMGGDIVTNCDVHAYVIDPDPKGMNVRSGPGSTYKIIGNLPKQDVEGIGVHITGSKGDWVRIDLAVEEGGEQERTLFKGEGWLYGPLLGVDGHRQRH